MTFFLRPAWWAFAALAFCALPAVFQVATDPYNRDHAREVRAALAEMRVAH